MAHMKTLMDFLTKNLFAGGIKKVNIISYQGNTTKYDSEEEAR